MFKRFLLETNVSSYRRCNYDDQDAKTNQNNNLLLHNPRIWFR